MIAVVESICDGVVVEACYGVMCPLRANCKFYLGVGLADGAAIESCQTGKSWPLFNVEETIMKQMDHDNEFAPLGQSKRQAKEQEPVQAKEEKWLPIPGHSGMEVDLKGNIRTNIPENKKAT